MPFLALGVSAGGPQQQPDPRIRRFDRMSAVTISALPLSTLLAARVSRIGREESVALGALDGFRAFVESGTRFTL
jgi:hypothetical protein